MEMPMLTRCAASLAIFVATFAIGRGDPATHTGVSEVSVRPTDIDVKGHANNARYLEYLQQGRWDWLERNGLPDASLREQGVVLVVVRIEIDYLREIPFPCRLRVSTAPEKSSTSSFVLMQEIARDDGVAAASAMVTMVAIDTSTRKSRHLPDSLRRIVDPSPKKS